MSTEVQSKRSRGVMFGMAAAGAVLGIFLAISETAVSIHAEREAGSDYQIEVKVLGMGVHRQAVRSTEELRPRMSGWGYGLTAAFALVGTGIGAATGMVLSPRKQPHPT